MLWYVKQNLEQRTLRMLLGNLRRLQNSVPAKAVIRVVLVLMRDLWPGIVLTVDQQTTAGVHTGKQGITHLQEKGQDLAVILQVNQL